MFHLLFRNVSKKEVAKEQASLPLRCFKAGYDSGVSIV